MVEPWNDKDMRWVLNYVMDREQIIEIAYEGTSIMGPYFWPLYPSMQKYTDLVPQETIDKFLKPNVEEAAHPGGEGLHQEWRLLREGWQAARPRDSGS